MKRASLHTLGCRLNQAETSVLESQLRKEGYELVAFGQPTDLLVVNTCSVTKEAERTCRYVVRKTLKHSPEAFVAVTGCYAQTGWQELRSMAGVDLIVGNQFKWDLPAMLPATEHLRKAPKPEVVHSKTIDRDDFILPDYGTPHSTRASVKIQDGCNVMCSFCLIPFARGHERSRVLEDAIREATLLAAAGYREIVLTGVNIGRYQQDGRDLLALIDALERIDGLERIRISSIEPTTIDDGLIERMAASSKLCPYLHVPLQSGDDTILSAMNRPYRVKDFAKLIERVVRAVPSLGLGTDVMVGFPGESEGAFLNTVRLAETLPFSYLHVFPFSPRPGTAALRMNGSVAPGLVRDRATRLAALDRAKRMWFAERHIGSTLPILFEAGETDGFASGTAPNFLRVAVAASDYLTSTTRSVRISAASERWAVGQVLPARHESKAPQTLSLVSIS
ncbi:putative tRNA modifying enzyme, MiaB-like [Nitrospira japonica]|uniref:Threonylcarbamoyladenosine tRNA methylthiotransferase MtaB n=1 Tax=Nitrospira japonica TaxID=1325564 RepID=A0A1W1I8P0_9BACT|nr:tRNA (N(6)-L-threonylcarbamoyladenosine(37)-C(2))-methylthiotransferase MtaB [Nitrospira japonica]SLM49355.1 putative tRNA modifying enzyme, MiaB-like [Nitrospira japonica]